MLAARGLLQCMASASTIMRRTAVQCVKRNASTVSTAADSAIPMEPSLPFMFTNRSMLSKQYEWIEKECDIDMCLLFYSASGVCFSLGH